MPQNMHYCQFENTSAALSEIINREDEALYYPETELSDSETSAKKRLLKQIKKIYESLDLGDEENVHIQ